MSTPESKVKKKVRELLDHYGADLYYNMPVPAGYGEPMLDFVGCFYGKFFMIETKAEGKVLTPRQNHIANCVASARGKVFIVRGLNKENDPESWEGWTELASWLAHVHLLGDAA